jgi:hypothetical protein
LKSSSTQSKGTNSIVCIIHSYLFNVLCGKEGIQGHRFKDYKGTLWRGWIESLVSLYILPESI